jgi:hypothetical protein
MSDDMPPPLPDGFECDPGTVPGWLNEAGLPTSCVGDHPCPGFDAETCLVDDNAVQPTPIFTPPIAEYPDPLPLDPLPTPEATVVVPVMPRELALTGPADGVGWDWLVVALLLVGVGFFFTANERKR